MEQVQYSVDGISLCGNLVGRPVSVILAVCELNL